ncbi:MAG: YkgJ family cysteine cluster protein [Candidatus Thermoplasmatota archaeon]|nr:YkgJ family cysteine cluster protein [Candidatus Thermoplasmatota archaeon]
MNDSSYLPLVPPVMDDISETDYIPVTERMRWECIRCGKCCGNNFTTKWLDDCVVPVVGPLVDNHCRYFDRSERKCTIYSSRPIACRGHPFTLMKFGDETVLKVHSMCPGIGHGDPIDLKRTMISILDDIRGLYDIDFMVDWSTVSSGSVRMHRLR